MMMKRKRGRKSGFSLLELMIVVAIIAILAAIGIPRMSRGTRGAADSALTQNLSLIRNSIDLYAAEHSSTYPDKDTIGNQLTQYTDASGNAQTSKDDTHFYGPYMRSIPPLPVGAKKGQTGIADADANDVGWIYTEGTGEIKANCADGEEDDSGKKYNTY